MARTGWFFSPVIEEVGADGIRRRRPKVADLRDPGSELIDEIDPITELPTGNKVHRKYSFTAAISDGQPGQDNDWCLVQVKGEDLSEVRAHPDIIDLLETDYDYDTERVEFLNTFVNQRLSAQAQARFTQKTAVRGITAKADARDRVKDLLKKAASRWNPNFNADLEKC